MTRRLKGPQIRSPLLFRRPSNGVGSLRRSNLTFEVGVHQAAGFAEPRRAYWCLLFMRQVNAVKKAAKSVRGSKADTRTPFLGGNTDPPPVAGAQ